MPFTPHNAATDGIARARNLLAQAPGCPTGVQQDLRRLGLVMAVAALDTYMHRLILQRLYAHTELPGKVASLDLPFAFALDQADESARVARAKPHNSRPRVALKRAVRDRLLRETYQSYDDVSAALGMAGLSGNWQAIGQQFSPSLASTEIRRKLNEIVTRRNQIVHEGDYERLDRPQTSRTNLMPHPDAKQAVDFLADLIDAIHTVA